MLLLVPKALQFTQVLHSPLEASQLFKILFFYFHVAQGHVEISPK